MDLLSLSPRRYDECPNCGRYFRTERMFNCATGEYYDGCIRCKRSIIKGESSTEHRERCLALEPIVRRQEIANKAVSKVHVSSQALQVQEGIQNASR